MGPEHKRWIELVYDATGGTSKMVPYKPLRQQIENEFPDSDIDAVWHWLLNTEKLFSYESGMPLFFYL